MSNTKGTSVINTPQGGGAQSGLGEKFSPDLFTGTGNFSVPIAVPPGRNGFQPQLTLGYSSGNGNGVFGMGWGLGVPGVSRKTSKGIPVYDDKTDVFILSGAEDLVPVSVEQETIVDPSGNIGWERTTYQPRTEGLFARIVRHKKTNGEHYWEVRSKDGLVSWYGTPGLGANDPAVLANPELRQSVFSWHLTKTEDPFGNVILYEYERDLVVSSSGATTNSRNYDQIYLTKINYAQYPVAGPSSGTAYLCEVRFNYEERPDAFSAYKQGFEVRTTKRCTRIELYTQAASLIKTKTYHFNYPFDPPLNGASLLESVSVEGHNGDESEWMPPLTFAYSVFEPRKRELQEIGGPLPPAPLSEPGFELVDLTGNGLPDLLQLNGTARYWTNQGNGQFSPPRNLDLAPSVQLGTPGVQMIDANGDGRSDLLVNTPYMNGYFAGAFGKVWDSKGFRPYRLAPSFNFADPEVQLMDLNGDGITDVLRNGSKFECFYNDPEKGFDKVRTADKLFANFSFADPRIRFADMTGDGLQDIVLISSGRVQYWPNMGYGRFGQKINMNNAPVFPEQYDPAQVLIGDLDGDGQADIAFVEMNRVTLYVNRSGNGFSDAVRIVNTPRVYNLKALRIIDLMGTGQAGILWSFGPDAATAGKMYFLDFTKGNKPYVLEQMNNNMGSLTRVSYGSSVYHYLRDEKHAATRWQTQLPFPVQVVNKVEVLDLLSGGKLVTRYDYHNGYWDGVEREFRGFAQVDSYDTERFERFNTQDLFAGTTVYNGSGTVDAVNSQFYTPPTLTKSWFYVGPLGDGYSRWKEPDFTAQYWPGDADIFQRPAEMTALLAGLPRRARRDALRTLRGSLLRSELYALDNPDLQGIPYTVTESRMSLRVEFEPSQSPVPLWNEKNEYWSGSGYVFFPFNVAQRTSRYERGNDPMHSVSFTRGYDPYGQAQGQLNVAVPRGGWPQSGGNGNYLASYTLTEYIYKNERDYAGGNLQYMVNRAKRDLGWDVTQSAVGKSVFDVRDDLFAQYTNNPLTVSFPVIACNIHYYDGPAFIGLGYGLIGDFGAQVRSESLVITDALITDAYGAATPQCFETSPNWVTGYPTAWAADMQDSTGRMGYVNQTGLPFVDGWYAESARQMYDFQDSLPAQEQVGRVLRSRDVFDAWSEIAYDGYLMMPVSSTQYLYPYGGSGNSLVTLAEYDYRVMQPFKVTDVNNNSSVFDFSPLGLLRATALIGKGGAGGAALEGDQITTTPGGYYTMYAPSVTMAYDFFAFVNTNDPVWVKTTSRELHYQQSALSETITKVEYSDGFGRLLQMRVQAEDALFGASSGLNRFGSSGLPADQSAANADAEAVERSGSDPLHVVVSGWKVYNNKGKVVEQYEPFFDQGFDYSNPLEISGTGVMQDAGMKITMFYDPLGRVVRTVNPDNSQQWVIYGVPTTLDNLTLNTIQLNSGISPTAWVNFSYDSNDLAGVPGLPGTNVPTTDYFTPKSAEVDALGRTIKTTEYHNNTNYTDVIEMNYRYDIRGNLLLVNDPYGRRVFEHIYDLRKPQKGADGKQEPLPPVWTYHIDKGESTILFDATGKAIEGYDAKGAQTLSAYDVISRPLFGWARNDAGAGTATLRSYVEYGDAGGSGAADNMNGKPYQSYDEAGRVQVDRYDFKGNTLVKIRLVIDAAVLKTQVSGYNSYIVDWTGFPSILDTALPFQTDVEYDALNRVMVMTLPQNVAGNRLDIVPTYNRAGALEKVTYDGTTYVENLAYNARGQRLLIAYGNGMMTRYTYDPVTFRLLRYRTEGYVKSQVGNLITYAYQSGTNRQDDGFNYDLVGNILSLFTRVSDCGINGSSLGSDALDRSFTYDSIYRVLSGNGRESTTQNQNTYLYTDAPAPGSPNANNVRSYARSYTYDKLGNVTQVKQTGSNGFTRNFKYTTGQNTLQLIEDGASVLIEAFSYDANGNQVTAGTTRNYVWNHADQLLCYFNKAGSANPTVFTQYDYGGQARVSKLVRTGTSGTPIYERTIYIDGVFEYVILENGTTYEKNYIHLMDDQSRMAEVRVNIGPAFPGDISDAVTYTLGDQIGSAVVRLNSSGGVIDKEEYYPFGDSSLRTFTYKRYRYVGKERDGESGLYYYGARYYAAWTCRFISVDALAGDYMYLTPYNYANNNPIDDYDIDGMQDTQTPTDSTQTANTSAPPTGGGADTTAAVEPPVVLPAAKVTGTPFVNINPKVTNSSPSSLLSVSTGGSVPSGKTTTTEKKGDNITSPKSSSVDKSYDNGVKVDYSRVDEKNITSDMDKVIKDIAKEAGFEKLAVTSAKRDESKQINTMYGNLMEGGNWEKNAVAWKKTYGSKGDKIIDAFTTAKRADLTESEIKQKMTETAINVGFKSAHSDYQLVAAIDFGINTNNLTKESAGRLSDAAKKNPNIIAKNVFNPFGGGKENALHIEIKLQNTKAKLLP